MNREWLLGLGGVEEDVDGNKNVVFYCRDPSDRLAVVLEERDGGWSLSLVVDDFEYTDPWKGRDLTRMDVVLLIGVLGLGEYSRRYTGVDRQA